MPINFEKLEAAASKACKDKVYLNTPLGSSNTGFSSISLSISGEDYRPVEKRRLFVANIPTSNYRSRENGYGRTESWHEPIETAKADAELLMLLWNDAEELIRLAKLGSKIETATAA